MGTSRKPATAIKVAVVGASGSVGRHVVEELVRRGHSVTGISTHPELISSAPEVTAVEADANDSSTLPTLIAGHDVVVTSIQYTKTDHPALIHSVRASGVPRYVVVGGSGTLRVPGTTTRIMDTPQFPESFRPPAEAAARFFDLLRAQDDLDWTILCPPPGFHEGQRTGRFRLGGDELLSDDSGRSAISYADFAIALCDEIENARHSKQRFTLAY